MAISIVGTISEIVSPNSTAVSFVDGNHTTTADTDLLLHFVALEGNQGPDTAPSRFDISGTDQALTLISDSGSTGSNTDVRVLCYGLVSPGAVTGASCRTDVQFTANPIAAVWVNISGVVTTSVAAATNDAGTYQDTSGTGSTTVLSSGGSTGNGLIAWAAAQSNSMQPSSSDNGFTEQVEGVTAATTSDLSYNLCTLLSGAPSAVTITWNTTEENSGLLVELIPATSTNLLPDYSGTHRGIMRGTGRGI